MFLIKEQGIHSDSSRNAAMCAFLHRPLRRFFCSASIDVPFFQPILFPCQTRQPINPPAEAPFSMKSDQTLMNIAAPRFYSMSLLVNAQKRTAQAIESKCSRKESHEIWCSEKYTRTFWRTTDDYGPCHSWKNNGFSTYKYCYTVYKVKRQCRL